MLKRFHQKHPIVFFGAALAVGFLIMGLLFYAYLAWFLPLPSNLTEDHPLGTTKILDRNGELLYEVFQPELGKKSVVPLTQIPQKFIQATLAAEDIHFYDHGGVDFWAIGRAIFFNLKEQRIVSGGSTITQQLVRNLLGFSTKRSYTDKALEAMYAIRLSHLYSKDQILELYLNKIYYGNLAYGAEAAALDYFGKHIYDLDLAESALLAGLPQAPSSYNPFVHPDQAALRQKYVLGQMVKYGFIQADEALAAEQENLQLRHNKVAIKAPHFVHFVMNQLDETLGADALRRGGFSIYTTLDYNLQIKAERDISLQIQNLHDKHVSNGALLSLDPQTGQILAWVGSENYFDDSIDGEVDMVTALRQPGSAIKPLNYLLALEKGYTPATILEDIATQFSTENGPYSPKNYDLRYHGPVRLREALASSFNIPAVKTLEYVGIEAFINFLKKLGIDTLNRDSDFYGLALTLGGGEVRMLDMAHAFNVLANYGNAFESSAVLKIVNEKGENIYDWKMPQKKYVLGSFGQEHAYQIIDILKDPLARLKGFGEGSLLEISHEAAVKTGTTRNFRDNWTIGFTPQLLTVVWVGNADASAMYNVTGIDGAAPIWHDFMEDALAFSPKINFVKPPRLKQIEICALSGKLPTELCQDRIYEWFVSGSEPQKPDDYFQKFTILKQTGLIVAPECVKEYPSSAIEEKVLVAYPPAFQGWAHDNKLQLPAMVPCALSKDLTSGYPNGYAQPQKGEEDGLTITNPRPNDEYELDSHLPIQSQKIPFTVLATLNTQTLSYFIDGEKATTIQEAPFSYLWIPTKGKHTLRAEATLASGEKIMSEEVSFLIL